MVDTGPQFTTPVLWYHGNVNIFSITLNNILYFAIIQQIFHNIFTTVFCMPTEIQELDIKALLYIDAKEEDNGE